MRFAVSLSLLALGSLSYAAPIARPDSGLAIPDAISAVLETRSDASQGPLDDLAAARADLEARSSTSSAAMSCTTIPSNGNRIHCVEPGTLSRPHELVPDTGADATTAGDCRDACLANDACISFGFDSSSATCTLYDKVLTRQGFTSDPSSSTSYSNRFCFKCKTAPTIIRNGDFDTEITPWKYELTHPDNTCTIQNTTYDDATNPAIGCTADSSTENEATVSISQIMKNLVIGQNYTISYRYMMEQQLNNNYLDVLVGNNYVQSGYISTAGVWLDASSFMTSSQFQAQNVNETLSFMFTNNAINEFVTPSPQQFYLDAVSVTPQGSNATQERLL